MRYIYFYTNKKYTENDKITFNLSSFKKLNLIAEDKTELTADYLDELKKGTKDKQYLVIVEVNADCIKNDDEESGLIQEKLTDTESSFQIHRVISLEVTATEDQASSSVSVPESTDGNPEPFTSDSPTDSNDLSKTENTVKNTPPNKPLPSTPVSSSSNDVPTHEDPIISSSVATRTTAETVSTVSDENFPSSFDGVPTITISNNTKTINSSESSSSSNPTTQDKTQNDKIFSLIKSAIDAIEDYLTFHKKVDIEAAKRTFYTKFPKTSAKINTLDNVAADSSSSSNAVEPEIKFDKGITRATAYLLLLQSENLDNDFKLLCLSSLLDTNNSTLLRQFVALTLHSKTDSGFDKDDTNLDAKSIISTQKNRIDSLIDKQGKEQNANFKRNMDATDALVNAVESLYKGKETELENIIPGQTDNKIKPQFSRSNSDHDETKEKSVLFANIAKRAIDKYLRYKKGIEAENSLFLFQQNNYPAPTLFAPSRKGINRALCYLNFFNSNSDQLQLLTVIGALLQTKNSHDLRFFIARELNFHLAIEKYFFKSEATEIEKAISNLNKLVNDASLQHSIEDNQTQITREKLITSNSALEELSKEIESNYNLDISDWLQKKLEGFHPVPAI